MFKHTHPYKPFLFNEATKLIVGTLPPPRFTKGELKPDDVDFCYGSRDGQLWKILDQIFNLNLVYETTDKAIQQRKDFLKERKIGICDIVASSERAKIDASDLGMQNIKLRNLIGYLKKYPNIDTLLFTGGNSKNGPEYFFRKHLKEHKFKLELVCDVVPRIHQFALDGRVIKTVSLTAPSGAANRAVGSLDAYKMMKRKNPKFNTIDFRILQYRNYF
ncbi:uracil-DNA glycosylase family protein [Cellulophaga baltica]|uniref:uracil-DNA glycosylase family protein n=1 Tax=Cellulophaga TaxID=104264 RepID=UPI001C067E53|nr:MULTISPECIES: uracil-DNA glycosylase family protein [Cellulophaga]MBU2994961.1 uracil-DNA glycosylase family protein [Cellulophaga baltica]MDO6766356.1 uracil-DNA glycosylase family protein [Cellulophaga sp. 1_MG-2023]